MTYELIPAGSLEQGDIIRHMGVLRKSPDAPDTPLEHYRTPVFVLSHGCEIDKKGADSVLVACVFKLSVLSKGLQEDLRKGRALNASYLPAGDPQPEECYIDWRTVQPIDKSVLLAARSSEAYLCTVSGELKDEIAGQFWDFLFRPRPSP